MVIRLLLGDVFRRQFYLSLCSSLKINEYETYLANHYDNASIDHGTYY